MVFSKESIMNRLKSMRSIILVNIIFIVAGYSYVYVSDNIPFWDHKLHVDTSLNFINAILEFASSITKCNTWRTARRGLLILSGHYCVEL